MTFSSYQRPSRRLLLASLTVLAARPVFANQPGRSAVQVYRDAACGCCGAWVAALKQNKNLQVTEHVTTNLNEIKQKSRIPKTMQSCHTAKVGSFVFEGHVPPADLARFLRNPPKDAYGLTVPGMPAGSPGMEVPTGKREPYTVWALFNNASAQPYARYK